MWLRKMKISDTPRKKSSRRSRTFGAGARGAVAAGVTGAATARSEEHTSELQSLMCISYAVFCLKKQKKRHEAETYAQRTQTHTALVRAEHLQRKKNT